MKQESLVAVVTGLEPAGDKINRIPGFGQMGQPGLLLIGIMENPAIIAAKNAFQCGLEENGMMQNVTHENVLCVKRKNQTHYQLLFQTKIVH